MVLGWIECSFPHAVLYMDAWGNNLPRLLMIEHMPVLPPYQMLHNQIATVQVYTRLMSIWPHWHAVIGS